MSIAYNTIGRIQSGIYKDWYILIKPLTNAAETSYQVFLCTDQSFQFDPAQRQTFDSWQPNLISLEGLLEDEYPSIEWQAELQPTQIAANPTKPSLTERLRQQVNKTDSEE
ncbi:hypothetical protein [Herpetosiphon llansteffanensis]|uniref:hypothetical protein n=1 Tax=Herpetosiphon llansteffanensis TaxID=2094568 RepID=UPI000D7CC99E|nr:hypothetical protein [Herpetosiphon llansteffanensis]